MCVFFFALSVVCVLLNSKVSEVGSTSFKGVKEDKIKISFFSGSASLKRGPGLEV